MKPMKMPKGLDTKYLPAHKRLAMGLPVNQPVRKGPKTPA